MGETQVTKDQLLIIDYVKDHLKNWMEEKRIIPFPDRDTSINPQLLERMVRVEEGIKHQNTNLEKMMIQMDQKFEIIDKRFAENREDMNTRFNDARIDMNTRFETMDMKFTEHREDMNTRFNDARVDMNTRFTAMDNRYTDMREDMNKRFNRQSQYLLVIFAAIVTSAVTVILQIS
ncbi:MULTISPECIES: hypothetical protein [unclassified Oceanispirochaeta]|uniref:hypothetical protein n=1 Tax=unclassified Oceanispirochaeta TaxID=2635722 RepID=UPI000E09D64F|nr:MULTISPECIES: hypothetical protein [unclassified Oceanispirochaeta]MBF9018012.1 hypothetical protein [Oceanispirochaeta sp. M2]NPD74524.1 hypothetical protein [Oceanispirochaeta sp. M1]RDG29637.1 hypothetical protein DV872_20690 [Oceanispirochaeta sp. M1]